MGLRFVRKLTTDVQGRFDTEYTNDLTSMPRFAVNLLVAREGFCPARQFVDFGVSDKTWEIDVMMRPDTESEDNEISTESLTSIFAPRLRASLENNATSASVKKDLDHGVEAFLDNYEPVEAVPSLTKVVKRYPDCGQGRTLLGLALLETADWSGATLQFVQADKLVPQREAGAVNSDKADSLLILAEMDNWKGDHGTALQFLLQATNLDPPRMPSSSRSWAGPWFYRRIGRRRTDIWPRR
jgi:hypothetical protein